jgi:2-amino-4-hydroxy-6-hydroxymethyldihydropteridine diphosphokinase
VTTPNIFLLLGSNLGDRQQHLDAAIAAVAREAGPVVAKSAVYETAPWGKIDQPQFLNQAIEIHSDFSAHELLHKILEIEQTLGRKRAEKWGERLIDIDLIYFDQAVISDQALTVPHPHLQERRFVLVPLTEISPQFVHPILRKTNEVLLAECADHLEVIIFTGSPPPLPEKFS